jgi:outer membrane protein OmpA-like peptidoglycan-associated protein
MTGATAKTELTLYRARTAARSGDLDEAARLLAALESPSPAVLDLQARVHAQRGELAEADRCWERVDSPEAAAGRAQLERIRSGRRRARPVVTTGRVATAAVLVCTLAAGGVAWSAGETPPPQADTQDTDRTRVLEQRLAVLERERAAAETDRSAALDAIAAAFTMPGVVVHRRAEDVQVVFDEGMFGADSAVVAPSATALLHELGRRLATTPATMTVVGHAVAVPGGRTSGGAPIALDRARAAAEQLATGGGLPLTAFTLTTADQQAGPHQDPSRNRTVTLLLTPADEH